MIMRCPKCQHELTGYKKVCAICGYQLGTVGKKSLAKGCFFVGSFIMLLVFLGGYFLYSYQEVDVSYDDQLNNKVTSTQKKSKDDSYQDPYLMEFIQLVKSQNQLPMMVDDVTTWTNITTEGKYVEYHYELLKSYSDNFYVDYIRSVVVGNVCANGTIQDLFKKGYYPKYSYTLEGTNRHVSFFVKRENCR